MKTLLIVAAIIVFLVHGFVMYCCIKVGAESEKNYDELAKGVRKEKGSKKMKEKDKVLQALCDGLGENYKLMEIDLELCIYRDFGNRFEVEVSGVHTAKQNKKATIYLWCMDATGAHGYVIKKVGEVPRNKIGKTVEELYEYSENLISQGYDCYEKVQAYLKELVKKEQIKKEEDNGAR